MSVLDAHEGSGSHCLSAHKLEAIIAKTNCHTKIMTIIIVIINLIIVTLGLAAIIVHIIITIINVLYFHHNHQHHHLCRHHPLPLSNERALWAKAVPPPTIPLVTLHLHHYGCRKYLGCSTIGTSNYSPGAPFDNLPSFRTFSSHLLLHSS